MLRFTGKTLLDQLKDAPTLLWLCPSLGLDTEQGIELICLLGIVLSFTVILAEPLRDSLVFACLWFLYLSVYQVSVCTCVAEHVCVCVGHTIPCVCATIRNEKSVMPFVEVTEYLLRVLVYCYWCVEFQPWNQWELVLNILACRGMNWKIGNWDPRC